MHLHFTDVDKPMEIDDLESAVIEIKHEKEIKERAKNIMEKTEKTLD